MCLSVKALTFTVHLLTSLNRLFEGLLPMYSTDQQMRVIAQPAGSSTLLVLTQSNAFMQVATDVRQVSPPYKHGAHQEHFRPNVMAKHADYTQWIFTIRICSLVVHAHKFC